MKYKAVFQGNGSNTSISNPDINTLMDYLNSRKYGADFFGGGGNNAILNLTRKIEDPHLKVETERGSWGLEPL